MNEDKLFEEEVKRLIDILSKTEPGTEMYANTTKDLNELCEARSKKAKRMQTFEALAGVGVNLSIVLIVVLFERSGILTTKAMSFVKK